MKIIMFSWEYPPKRVGGIAAALEGLCPALAKQNVEVHVITCGDAGGELTEEQEKNLFIHRVLVARETTDFLHWVHELNGAMAQKARELLDAWQKPQSKTKKKQEKEEIVLHVHDWLGLFAGTHYQTRVQTSDAQYDSCDRVWSQQWPAHRYESLYQPM